MGAELAEASGRNGGSWTRAPGRYPLVKHFSEKEKGVVAGGGCKSGVFYATATFITAHLFAGRENKELSDVRTGDPSIARARAGSVQGAGLLPAGGWPHPPLPQEGGWGVSSEAHAWRECTCLSHVCTCLSHVAPQACHHRVYLRAEGTPFLFYDL